MELSTSITGGRVLDTHTYTLLYKVDVQKEGEVDGEQQVSHTGSLHFSVAVNFQHVTQNIWYCSRGVLLYEHIPNGSRRHSNEPKKVKPLTQEMRLDKDTCEYHHVRDKYNDTYTHGH